jgi:FkbM family methyltransferase
MNIFKFLNRLFTKIKQKLFNKIYVIILKQREKKFEILFNFFSLINKSINIKVNFLDGSYFIIDDKKKYKFFPIERVALYQEGLAQRAKYLKEDYLLNNIKFHNDDIIIDIGANNGDFYFCFDEKIKYYGYEPSPIVFSNLQYNIKNQNLYNLGLSNSDKQFVDFYLKDESGDSSILPINNYTKKITIETTSLDKEIDKIKEKIKLIKIEAEGLEPEILQGLNKYLNHVEYITIDCGFERGVKQESTIAECSNHLIQNNFMMIGFTKNRIVALFKNLNM